MSARSMSLMAPLSKGWIRMVCASGVVALAIDFSGVIAP